MTSPLYVHFMHFVLAIHNDPPGLLVDVTIGVPCIHAKSGAVLVSVLL
jgi:hypothetical protein